MSKATDTTLPSPLTRWSLQLEDHAIVVAERRHQGASDPGDRQVLDQVLDEALLMIGANFGWPPSLAAATTNGTVPRPEHDEK
jgi:hypothetical protein